MGVFDVASIGTIAATLLGAIIGASASIASTYWLHNKRLEAEEQQLRQALIAEVDSMETEALGRVAEQIQKMGTREERQEAIEQEVQRMFSNAGDEEALEAVPDELTEGIFDWGAHMFAQGPANTLEEISSIDLSTEVYDANLDKIGRLDVSDIEDIIEFYKRIHKTQQIVDDIIQSLEKREQETDVSQYGGRLRAQANGLTSQKEQVLLSLRKEGESSSEAQVQES